MSGLKRALQVIRSVGAAMLGVQSRKQADNDFASPSALPYIIVGIIFVLLLIAMLATIVSMQLK